MNRPSFKDHFSGHAEEYARYRPTYSETLFAWLAETSPEREVAWDCATGNGQAATALARHFTRVIATDASRRQIDNVIQQPGIEYRVCPAEENGLQTHSVDLVTIGQALHWFDLPAFYQEVRRVLKPGGMIAAWSYALFQVTPEIDKLIKQLYSTIVGAYWPRQRSHVDSGYAHLAFPFHLLPVPQFEMVQRWQVEQALGYLNTWSAVQRFRHDRLEDPLLQINDELERRWGCAQRKVTWPLHLKVGIL